MDFSFSDRERAFAEEARAWLEAHVPSAWRRDHCWSRADDPLWFEIARDWQRPRSETIMGGTSEIQRNVIAQRILGLPR